MTHISHTAQDPNVDSVRRQLEQHLQDRLDTLADLAPRALPSIDPVAYQTAASNRMVVEQIAAALNRLSAGTYGRCTRCGGQIAPRDSRSYRTLPPASNVKAMRKPHSARRYARHRRFTNRTSTRDDDDFHSSEYKYRSDGCQ